MSFYINAWLDRADPFVSVCDRNNKQEIIRFEKQELSTLLNSGELCMSDFCSSDSHAQQVLVKDLLLMRCCFSIRAEVRGLGQQLSETASKVLRFPRSMREDMAENDPLWPLETKDDVSLQPQRQP